MEVYYSDQIPIEQEQLLEWFKNGIDVVRISFVSCLDDLIECKDMEAVNEMVDHLIGISLVDIAYGIDYAATNDLVQENEGLTDQFVMWVEGSLEGEFEFLGGV